MDANSLRKKFLEFFKSKGHAIIPSASLIPENDPTVLFTTAGMHPLVPYLLGEKHSEGTRLTDAQKCIRTSDIDEVGDATHHTFFEMLGNWSLGDYFKEEAIKMSWEFLTKVLKLDKNKIAVSVFAGDEDALKDEEAKKIWLSLNIPENRIAELSKKDNWWGPAGVTGPCGPDTEIFYWTGKNKPPEKFNPEDNPPTGGWVEIWNNVFMQYNKNTDGSFSSLAQKNVDTGMGLERTLAVLNDLDDNYQTELFLPIIEKIEELSGKKYEENQKEMRIIADHIKASVMILGDEKGIAPSNTGQGYILRRLIRRAVRYGKQLGIAKNFIAELAEEVIKIYENVYPKIKKNKEFIFNELEKEEEKFYQTLEKGLKEFDKWYKHPEVYWEENLNAEKIALEKIKNKPKRMPGFTAFRLFTTFGFPIELTVEIAKEKEIIVDLKDFNEEMKKHAELSRTASAGIFKGGLADASEETKRLHTAAHLMLEALRRVLGPHVEQKGSNITPERLRFDFSHPEKMTPEQIKQVENLVNEQIKKDLPVRCEEMPLEEAKKLGATGVFEHKYGELAHRGGGKIKVYFIGEEAQNFSKEICGGPHVSHTGELKGIFKITKEESSSAGIRRLRAILI